jgi:hypothetical protein
MTKPSRVRIARRPVPVGPPLGRLSLRLRGGGEAGHCDLRVFQLSISLLSAGSEQVHGGREPRGVTLVQK